MGCICTKPSKQAYATANYGVTCKPKTARVMPASMFEDLPPQSIYQQEEYYDQNGYFRRRNSWNSEKYPYSLMSRRGSSRRPSEAPTQATNASQFTESPGSASSVLSADPYARSQNKPVRSTETVDPIGRHQINGRDPQVGDFVVTDNEGDSDGSVIRDTAKTQQLPEFSTKILDSSPHRHRSNVSRPYIPRPPTPRPRRRNYMAENPRKQKFHPVLETIREEEQEEQHQQASTVLVRHEPTPHSSPVASEYAGPLVIDPVTEDEDENQHVGEENASLVDDPHAATPSAIVRLPPTCNCSPGHSPKTTGRCAKHGKKSPISFHGDAELYGERSPLGPAAPATGSKGVDDIPDGEIPQLLLTATNDNAIYETQHNRPDSGYIIGEVSDALLPDSSHNNAMALIAAEQGQQEAGMLGVHPSGHRATNSASSADQSFHSARTHQSSSSHHGSPLAQAVQGPTSGPEDNDDALYDTETADQGPTSVPEDNDDDIDDAETAEPPPEAQSGRRRSSVFQAAGHAFNTASNMASTASNMVSTAATTAVTAVGDAISTVHGALNPSALSHLATPQDLAAGIQSVTLRHGRMDDSGAPYAVLTFRHPRAMLSNTKMFKAATVLKMQTDPIGNYTGKPRQLDNEERTYLISRLADVNDSVNNSFPMIKEHCGESWLYCPSMHAHHRWDYEPSARRGTLEWKGVKYAGRIGSLEINWQGDQITDDTPPRHKGDSPHLRTASTWTVTVTEKYDRVTTPTPEEIARRPQVLQPFEYNPWPLNQIGKGCPPTEGLYSWRGRTDGPSEDPALETDVQLYWFEKWLDW